MLDSGRLSRIKILRMIRLLNFMNLATKEMNESQISITVDNSVYRILYVDIELPHVN